MADCHALALSVSVDGSGAEAAENWLALASSETDSSASRAFAGFASSRRASTSVMWLCSETPFSFTSVKKESLDDATAEDVVLLNGAVGTCLRRDEELQQAVDRLSANFNAMQRDVGNLTAQLTPEVIVELSPDLSSREPGDVPKCSCKRLRKWI